MTSSISVTVEEEFDSPRLLIRSCRDGDGLYVHAAETETFEQIRQWFGPWAREPYSPEKTEERILQSKSDFSERSELVYNCYLKEDGNLVGRGWFARIDWSVPKCNFGLWVRSSRQRQGFGLEMAVAFTRFGIEQIGFKRFEIYVDPRNQPSLKMFEKLGFTYEGKLRNYSYDNLGIMRDYLVFSVTPADMDCLSESLRYVR